MLSIRHDLLFILAFNVVVYIYFFSNYHPHTDSAVSMISQIIVKKDPINACIIFLVRNEDLKIFAKNLARIEANYNHKYNYPYVLFNDQEFTAEFKNNVTQITKSHVDFAVIPSEYWDQPPGLDAFKVSESIIWRGQEISYRKMCRFYSGFFFRHNATLKYDYYMRFDVDSELLCPLEYDPFEELIARKKKYGFVLAEKESIATITTLWPTVKEWIKTSGRKPALNNTVRFVSDDNGETLSKRMCIIYNNFEIASFSLFRSKEYREYFEFLDSKAGFYYERWGDAPVHTFYISLMLKKTDVHMFKDLHYSHANRTNHHEWDLKCKYPQVIFKDKTTCTYNWLEYGYE